MSRSHLEAAMEALHEAEAAALASIGERGTYAIKRSFEAIKRYQAKRWRAICVQVPISEQVVTAQELGISLTPDPRTGGYEGG